MLVVCVSFLSTQGCALMGLPMALLSLPIMLISTVFGLIGPVLNMLPSLAPLALLVVKKEPSENVQGGGPTQLAKSNINYLEGKAVHEVVLSHVSNDPAVKSIIFIPLLSEKGWALLDETVLDIHKHGYSVSVIYMRKKQGLVDQGKINEVSRIMEQKKIEFLQARAT